MRTKKVLDTIELVIKIICQIFISVIVVVVSYAVVMRYVFNRAPFWSQELTTYMYVWLVVLGAVLVTRDKTHIDLTFIVDSLPEKFRFVWYNFIRLLVIGFCGLMVQQGYRLCSKVSDAASPSLGISVAWVYLSIPTGGFLMAIYFIEQSVKSIIDRRRQRSA